MKQSSIRIIVPAILLSVGSLVVVVLIQRDRDQIAPIFASRLADYDALSGAEQNRIRDNFEVYEEMTEAERSVLHQIHAATLEDPELEKQLDAFYSWWMTLDRVDRDEILLDPETDPIDRIRAEIAWVTGPERFVVHLVPYSREAGAGNGAEVLELTAKDLEQLLAVAEELAPPPNELLAGITDERQRLLVRVSALLDRLAGSPRGSSSDESETTGSDLALRIIEAIPDSAVRERLQASSDFSQEMAVRWILWTGGYQIGRSFLSKLEVTDDEFVAHFTSLTPREQSTMMKLDADRAVRAIQMDAVSSENRFPPTVLDAIRRFTQRSWVRRRDGSPSRDNRSRRPRPDRNGDG